MLESLLSAQQTSLDGLSQEEATKRLENSGPNELKASKRTSYLRQFLAELKDLMVIILIIASILALISGEITDAILIIAIVFINAFIGFIQKFKAEKALEALKKLVAPTAKVIRGGKLLKIPAREIVPGDMLSLDEGDHIGADAVVIEENELETQESALTGESIPVQKQKYEDAILAENSLFMGTIVVHGTGKAIVTKTGMETEMGKIATLTTTTTQDKTPLEKEIQRIGLFAGQITVVISFILFCFGVFIQQRGIIATLLFATSVAVAAVPEGLPTTITIALAIGVQRLTKKNAIVKQLSSVETLGATTVICSDKTGTLTQNEMTVKTIYGDGFEAIVEGSGYEPKGRIIPIAAPSKLSADAHTAAKFPSAFEWLIKTAAFCNNARLTQDTSLTSEVQSWNMVGDPTEGALMTLVRKSPFDFEKLSDEYEKLHEYPFDSTRKCMTVIMRERASDKMFAFSKGAPESIIGICSHVAVNDHALRLDPKTIRHFNEKKTAMAGDALRVLAFAYKELPLYDQKVWEKKQIGTHFTGQRSKEAVEKELTLLGMVGMIDPPRPEIKEAIALTKKAGIKVYVVTGDEGLTAEAIARNIGLFGGNDNLVITGRELEVLADTRLKKLFSDKAKNIIFARVSPADKLRIVSVLKDLGEVVAVTGDGVNDAPALKRSDIGVAMGSGTDVSKEASNIILTDDSFSTIVKAIKEGRTIYDNLKKFVFFIFSSNIGEVMTIFLAIIFNLPAPLTPILILCINLFTDVLPALALSVEPAEKDIMAKPPRHPYARMLAPKFVKRMLFFGFVMGLMTIGIFVWDLLQSGWHFGQALRPENPRYLEATTMAFILMVFLQMAHTLNSKSDHLSIFKSGFTKNTKLLLAILSSIVVTVLIVEVPFLQKYFHTTGMSLKEWLVIGAASLFIIVLDEVRKLLVRNRIIG